MKHLVTVIVKTVIYSMVGVPEGDEDEAPGLVEDALRLPANAEIIDNEIYDTYLNENLSEP